jgi:ABC-type branched-subunit amino acid transport system substrate-binding protein
VKIIADIMQRVGIKPEDIKNALYQVKDYPGVNGAISFDENGDLTSAEYEIHVVQGGKSVIKKS